MKCPFCGFDDTIVKDSRNSDDNTSVRRRRECPECGSRFTTFERVQLRELTVVKKNGEKTPFDREKLYRSIALALRKRPISPERIDKVVTSLVRKFESSYEGEISTSDIGQAVMDSLSRLDHVGYIRFASVYKDFREVKDFEDFVKTLDELVKPATDDKETNND
ncbi:MAG: transcriptional repressor NrdR [Alphaproteobacteria bacterium]|nr:transcriptional repressor NrdR [Alphaproteobacteria bacterium]